jgi:hypothetical protein
MKWTPELLEPYRHIGDKEADDLFQKVFEEGEVEGLNEAFKLLATNKHNNITPLLKDPALIAEFEAYLDSLTKLPSWADRGKMQKASELFHLYYERISLLLLCKSLPTCYSCAKGAKVLNVTGRIEVHDGSLNSMTRRILETAQFVFNILAYDAFEPEGKGFQSVQKVRLMHASIRTYAKNLHWDFDKYDSPLNQEDLAGTLLTFSTIVLQGLEQTGIKVEQDHKEGYMHFWKVIGSMMGVHEQLLVDDAEDGKVLMDVILKHQQAPSEDGKKLTASCVLFIQSGMKFKFLKKEPIHLIRFFVGAETANMLGVADLKTRTWVVRLLEFLFNKQESSIGLFGRIIRGIFYVLGNRMLNRLKAKYNEGKKYQFEIPASISG